MNDDSEETLRAALETLPDEMRRCFLLHFGQGFDEGEIAVLLRIPVAQVHDGLQQALARLRSGDDPPRKRDDRSGPRRIS
ncbi:MAG TPA: sigma factor-like helix-turn-helix DNA-binding protein [Thermoanaerobaculia bacterium]|jgi:DNA-directed RNA polymerase specialized sigma24 family protein|nr:sigma factor-like helix-turn-helix DNA-binding protein [Thermoanaerobaculia bacterium]